MIFQQFFDSTDLIGSPSELRKQLKTDGYLFLRNVIPKEDLARTFDHVRAELAAANWLENAEIPTDLIANTGAACVEPEPNFRKVYDRVYFLERFHSLPHHPRLKTVISDALGIDDLLPHPRPIGRLIFPMTPGRENFSTPAHQDYWALQGSPDTVTVWIPLHDCPVQNGALMVAEGTHRDGIYDYKLALGAGGVEVSDPLTDRWRSGNFGAGDVLIFYTLTVHKASPNVTNRMRLSIDCRYQSAQDPISELAFQLKGEGYDWDDLYSGWESTALRYYWSDFQTPRVPYNPKYYARRDVLALEEGAKGNKAAISTLQRLARFGSNDSVKRRAEAILATFNSE
ncbi:phytanoyl-CoA dioxygenase family protein (plasmid) [Agrobacterium tumefaciens]|uniref:Phytanoil-CoA alpha hydroxylase protein n=3 Tax=Rhizobiaceae TaxID=82115 RepID=B9JQP2_RHIR8|nr:phytanoyl-CoA dioxygenase family protein [Agrobacterium tumefaciens]AAS02148.1 probable phytanoil-CoA alpha hydroxylase [Agrobacterium radiobacter]ACM31484.1 phytanoil-CoA alpha hydroxylase protein [Rhizobium rhizogenes K84]UXS56416.1 phytanoyl-CoA dioxygenase family protein [Agrobacterium tumefaciens]